ncbi:O-succinylbenzoate--CoA ligase [Candidatus Thiomargarita nelsonii]|uniref:O-succinylbenzoate--CoA ligase n=1 Tax=Candidatus Thiomargarita nelsonii TaxID=1003181 RepID=A0A4E0QSS2_9GAMM|nr:O-succinylbenzoate--CoA ligase [Candidatus Thiomargarita nelsonii]
MFWIIEKLTDFAEQPAIVDNDITYSYLQLVNQITNYKKQLDEKINNGDVVVLSTDYSFHSIALFFALLLKRCILVPIVSQVEEEVTERIKESYADWVIKLNKDGLNREKYGDNRDKHEMIKSLQDAKHAGLILFSSGSTGKPKAMIHNLNNLLETYKTRKHKPLSIMVFLMFDHIGGLNTLLNSLSMGAKIVIPGTRDADEIGSLIEKHKINILPASPTFLNLMLISETPNRYVLSSLKMITYGTEPMPESLLKRLKANFPRTRFLQTFGTSETGIAQTSSRSSTSLDIRLNDSNQEYKIVNGELWLRSQTQVLGYLNANMDSFTKEGWFKTGDLVEELKDGYLRIIGRNKEIINVGGEKVFPAEIESVLLEIPEIDDCMVYGEKNAITGQNVVADVVLRNDIEPKLIKRLVRKYCKEKLDSYKIPTKINVKDKTNFSERFKKMRLHNG